MEDDIEKEGEYARDNFKNCWKQYHSLGDDGVMDNLHEKFLDFPTETPNK